MKEIIGSFAKDVARKSSVVFLWVRFAVFAITEARGQGFNQHALKAKLETVPPDLTEIYARIFEPKPSDDRRKTGIVLRLITSAKRGILLSELFEASYLAGILTRPSNVTVDQGELDDFQRYTLAIGGRVLELCPTTIDESIEHLIQQDQYFRQISRGYARIGEGVPAQSSGIWYVFVKVLHRSVQTYLDKRGWSTLLDDDEASTCRSLAWLNVCVAFCKLDFSENRSMHLSKMRLDLVFCKLLCCARAESQVHIDRPLSPSLKVYLRP